MKAQKSLAPTTELEKTRQHFESWRRTKEHNSTPIPEELWQEAVGLTKTHSIHEISTTLHLDFNHLKRRVQRRVDQVEDPVIEPNTFVELSLSTVHPVAECVIEFEHPDTSRMRISIKGGVDWHLIELTKAFWSRP